MKCPKCNNHGVVLGEGKKPRWKFCDCEIGVSASNLERNDRQLGSMNSIEQGRNKYSAKPTERYVKGELVKFASKGEAMRWDVLERREKEGLIRDLKAQPRFELRNAFVEIKNAKGRQLVYTADYSYVQNGRVVIEDFKSGATMTEAARLRIAVFESLYKLRVTVITKEDIHMLTESELPEGVEIIGIGPDGDPDAFLVKGSKDNLYRVAGRFQEEPDTGDAVQVWSCTCPAYEYGDGKPCKHMKLCEVA